MLTGLYWGLTADFVWGTLQSTLCVLAHLLFNPMALVYYPHFTKEELRLRMLLQAHGYVLSTYQVWSGGLFSQSSHS